MDKIPSIGKLLLFAVILSSAVISAGCAGIEPPSPDKILSHPLGMGPIDIGMAKAEVKEQWGEPDIIRNIGESNDIGSTQKEEWVYYGRMRNLPVNYGYLAKSLHLYFDGNNLTSFKEE
ncbi:MAG: hypothetical protein PHO42_01470 [Candidatus Omnitrophica bacterium]|nr:hypothetical protein [Candidatus Omnitrophota bacterium]